MPRVIGVDIPDNKRLVIALTYIHGVGRHTSVKIIESLGLDPNMRARELTEADIGRLNSHVPQEYTVEGDRRRSVQNAIKRLISIHSYRGLRHRSGLPVRGQGTQTNARTRKGRKKTVANKKK
ncbi:30S ribosomal protein S13 [Chlamydiales bacterium SCGC AG-110-P3]|nr:30S ribosomal protein S13 [Chlamydiales bacterium SCGC AG-110-P3]